MDIIGFLNSKGGVGKSTMTQNVAIELSRVGLKVLLIDLDFQLNNTRFFRRQLDENFIIDNNVIDVLKGKVRLSEAWVQVTENLYFVAGAKDVLNFNHRWSKNILKHNLKDEACSFFDLVLIDNSAFIGRAVESGLMVTNAVVIVSDTEQFSQENLDDFIDTVKEYKKQNESLNILGIAINKYDTRRKDSKFGIRDLKERFGDYVFNTVIRDRSAVTSSHRQGLGIRKLSWNDRTIGDFYKLSREIAERLGYEYGE